MLFVDCTILLPSCAEMFDSLGTGQTWLAPVIHTTLFLKASLGSLRDPRSFRSASALQFTLARLNKLDMSFSAGACLLV